MRKSSFFESKSQTLLVSLLTNIPGVGRKTAERLIVELRDRMTRLDLVETGTPPLSGGSEARADALAALEQLGYSRAQTEQMK